MSEEWEDKDEGMKFPYISWFGGSIETPEQRTEREQRESATKAVNALAAEHITRLPPFDPHPLCPKCGHDGVKWNYGRFLEPPNRPLKLFDRVGLLPYLDLYCLRCEFGNHDTDEFWVMRPKDCP